MNLAPMRCSFVRALHVPADPREPVAAMTVQVTAAAMSEAIGGGLCVDSYQGVTAGDFYMIHLDEERIAKGLPDNPRGATLAARLGHIERAWLADVRGDLLVTGCTLQGDELDAPASVFAAANRMRLIHDE